ncbi:hypothetical protein GQR60_12475 [Labilibaculum sp. A4]|uniref:hypothetical protein n=1 Tax=Labilibaculum euxinus TaxID=2686357 RepID=UPI000F61613C|nr:hypothetical protein [Labilibaculum euxinus]MDQ1771369.1 hypothetical protein [Labilibaculum euxinus]MWN77157.1 hypothetical protein [Labilibaculum euxinus]
MKTNFTKLFSVCFFLFLGFAASAQTDTRSVGESKAYTVTPESGSNGLLWTLSGTSGTDWNITAGALNSGSITVLWMKPGTYNMTFTETESHTGVDCSTTKTLTVTVNADFSVAIADASSAASCATGSTGTTDVTFVLTKTNGSNDWTFDYTTVGLTSEITGNDVAVSGGTHNLVISLANTADGSDQTFKVQISDVKDSFGNPAGDDDTNNVTIYGVPNTGNISF